MNQGAPPTATKLLVTEARLSLADAARNKYRMVLETALFPANPIETYTGDPCRGTVTLRTSIEYAGAPARQCGPPFPTTLQS